MIKLCIRIYGEKLMKISELQDKNITDDLVDKILYENLEYYNNQFVDIAIVLGSSKAHIYRLPPVVDAYKKGNVKKIITSGHTRKMNERYINEGKFLRDKALEMGVSESDIIVEGNAENTWENLYFSREILEQKGLLTDGRTIAIATSSYHMRRSLCIAKRVFAPYNLNIISFLGEDNSTRRDTWYANEKGRKRCYGEIYKIIWSINQGIIDDWSL